MFSESDMEIAMWKKKKKKKRGERKDIHQIFSSNQGSLGEMLGQNIKMTLALQL